MVERVCDYLSWARHFIQGRPYVIANPRDNQLERLAYFETRTLGRRLHILEVGSYRGHSALIWAKYGSVVCVDRWHDSLNERIFHSNIRRFDKQQQIHAIKGPSHMVLRLQPRESFDIVYIDAAHDYQGCLEDLENSQSLVRLGGLICVDDYDNEHPELCRAVHSFLRARPYLAYLEADGLLWFRVERELGM